MKTRVFILKTSSLRPNPHSRSNATLSLSLSLTTSRPTTISLLSPFHPQAPSRTKPPPPCPTRPLSLTPRKATLASPKSLRAPPPSPPTPSRALCPASPCASVSLTLHTGSQPSSALHRPQRAAGPLVLFRGLPSSRCPFDCHACWVVFLRLDYCRYHCLRGGSQDSVRSWVS